MIHLRSFHYWIHSDKLVKSKNIMGLLVGRSVLYRNKVYYLLPLFLQFRNDVDFK